MTCGKFFFHALALAVFGLLFASTSFADNAHQITQMGHDIVVGQGQKTGDLTCFGCSIRIHGAEVAGDVTSFGGTISVDDQSQVDGDVTAIEGNARVEKYASVAGDLTVLGGQLRRDPASHVDGDVTSMGGRGWFWLILAAPFALLGLVIALIVWFVQWIRRPTPAHA